MGHDDEPPFERERRPIPPASADGPALELSLAKTLDALRAVTQRELEGIEPAHGSQWIAEGASNDLRKSG